MDDIKFHRVSEALREELGELISYELADPRIDSVTVTEVLVTPDRKKAVVRINIADVGAEAGAIDALTGAKGFLRKQLANRLDFRNTPELTFESDKEVPATKVESLLKRIKKGRPRDAEPQA